MDYFSEDGEEKESAPRGENCLGDISCLTWSAVCEGEGHEQCAPSVVSDFDAVLDRKDALGGKRVATPLQALFCAFLLRRCGSTTNSRRIVTTLVGSNGGDEFVMFLGSRGDSVPVDAFPSPRDLTEALEARVRSCKVAWRALADSGFHPLHLEPPPLPFGADCRAEHLGWTTLFGQASWALETLRASLVHRRRLIDVPRVVFGDSSAAQITQNAEMTAVELLTSEEGLAGAIRALDDVVLSGKVKALLIVIGRDALLANETSETMDEHLGRIRDICSRYGHVFILWAVPPYVHVRKLQYEEFVRSLARLVSGTKIRLGHISEDGRSLGEVFRYGATFAGHRVSKTGLMTEHGAKAMIAWIMDVGKFPGERELGKPRPKSQVVRVAPILATDRRPNRGRGGGLGLGDHRRLDSSRLARLAARRTVIAIATNRTGIRARVPVVGTRCLGVTAVLRRRHLSLLVVTAIDLTLPTTLSLSDSPNCGFSPGDGDFQRRGM
uniref:Uncharacterized protein n=2 Tax=Globodera rostochiensis TaxID=31243 RepID=A0A914HVN7_GLORO